MKSITPFARWAACAAVLLLVSVPAAGQGKWWQLDEFKRELGLTQEQTRVLEEIFQKALPTLKVQKTRLDQAEELLKRLIEQGDQAAMEQINVVEAARRDLNVTRSTMLYNMRKHLTLQQWVKLTALQAAANKAAASRPPQPQTSNGR
jgi:Spy/CpxP family protein refolding chaperone